MSTFEEFPNQEETMFLSSEEIPNPESTENSELDELNNKISELSKRGYQLLKENDVENAINSFKEIFPVSLPILRISLMTVLLLTISDIFSPFTHSHYSPIYF
jgi:hypothetical protein